MMAIWQEFRRKLYKLEFSLYLVGFVNEYVSAEQSVL